MDLDYTSIFTFLTDPLLVFLIFTGVFLGLIFGALPGLSTTMGVAILLPITFSFEPLHGIAMLLGTFIGGISGAMIPSVLINIPGTPAGIVTTFDGYPLAEKGKGAQALGWAVLSSGVGTFFSWMILVLLAPQIAMFALSFSAPEYAALALFGLTIIAAVSGDSIVKGLIAGLIGIWLTFIGIDPVQGNVRFTFDYFNLMSGIELVPALVGFYAIPQVLISVNSKIERPKVKLTFKNIFPPIKELWKAKFNMIRSSIIGTLIGIIPATGASIGSFISYDVAKRFSKNKDTFGKGNPEGVVASETANNGVIGGALIPVTTLGIPGDAVTAIILGGLMLHGITPGPTLFAEHGDLMIGIFTAVLVGTLFMVLIQLVGIRFFVKILSAPFHYLAPVLVILAVVGSFALRNSYFDVLVTLILGLFGYLLVRAKFPLAPIVLGIVLGPIFESELRRSLEISNGDWMIFLTRPVSGVIIAITAFVLITIIISTFKKNKVAS